MQRLSREFGLSLLLALACGVLAAMIAVEWGYARKKRERTLRLPEVDLSVSAGQESGDLGDFVLPDLNHYEIMVQRPLFVAGRRPEASDQDTGASSAADQSLANWKLMGIVLTPYEKTALLVDAQGKYKRVRKDGILESWKLTELFEDRVVLQQGEERKEFILLKPKPKTSAEEAAAQPPPGAAPQRPRSARQPPPPPEETDEEAGAEEEDEPINPEDEE